jgi:site-specific DNA-methyltransferase (adenine-specific)
MQIVEKKLDELREYENNPRNNENAVAAVAASIKEFGFKVPLVIDAAGVIIAGHTRAKAAAQLGLQTVPCIVADDLTEEQIRAFRLADNKTGELAGWDFEKLNAELELLQGMDMSEFGFITSDDVDIDEFFEDTDGDDPKEKEPKRIQCPHCGEWLEIE